MKPSIGSLVVYTHPETKLHGIVCKIKGINVCEDRLIECFILPIPQFVSSRQRMDYGWWSLTKNLIKLEDS